MKYPVQFQDSENNTLRGIVSIVGNDKTKPIIILAHGFSIDKETSPMPELLDKFN